MNFKATPVKNY